MVVSTETAYVANVTGLGSRNSRHTPQLLEEEKAQAYGTRKMRDDEPESCR